MPSWTRPFHFQNSSNKGDVMHTVYSIAEKKWRMLTAAHVNGGINRPIFNFFNFFKTIIIIVFSVLNTGRAHSIREGRPCRMRVIEKQPFRRQESTEFHVYSLRDKHGQVDPTRKTVRSETPLDVPNHVHWLFHCQKKTTTKTLYTIAYVWGKALEMFEETYPPPSLV
jgi:hypothetical protein